MHKVFGEANAILAGDALLTRAFGILACYEGGTARRLVEMLSQAAGIDGMVGGQVADIANEGKSHDEGILEFIHSRKTGALIRASLMMGGIGGGEATRARAGCFRSSDGSWGCCSRW